MFAKLSILPLISGSYVVHFSSPGGETAQAAVPLSVLGRHFSCALPARKRGDDGAWTALRRAAWLRGRCLDGQLEGQACPGRESFSDFGRGSNFASGRASPERVSKQQLRRSRCLAGAFRSSTGRPSGLRGSCATAIRCRRWSKCLAAWDERFGLMA